MQSVEAVRSVPVESRSVALEILRNSVYRCEHASPELRAKRVIEIAGNNPH